MLIDTGPSPVGPCKCGGTIDSYEDGPGTVPPECSERDLEYVLIGPCSPYDNKLSYPLFAVDPANNHLTKVTNATVYTCKVI